MSLADVFLLSKKGGSCFAHGMQLQALKRGEVKEKKQKGKMTLFSYYCPLKTKLVERNVVFHTRQWDKDRKKAGGKGAHGQQSGMYIHVSFHDCVLEYANKCLYLV